MITIIYSTHKGTNYNTKFQQHLLETVGLKDVQILEYVNHNQYSLSQVYNSGITESIYDIVVCCHNDIKLEKNWGKKLLEDYSKNPEFGIIGKAGSCYFPESGVYWEKLSQTMVGQVYHHPEGQKKWLSKYSPKFPFLIPVVTIDGLFISFDKTKIKHKFDETIGRFHFYDHLFCVPNYIDGVKIGVTTSFEITHESVGQPNEEFWSSRELFVKKWGSNLPLDLKPIIHVPEIKRKEFKKFRKVAIIIPTKGKVEMLLDCINSFQEYCDKNKFTIFIADTGSSPDEIQTIKTNIDLLDNVKLIQYDYYNFAKINNDVVKNHVNDDHEFVLFSNNDIKILNDVLTGMLSVFEKNKNAGTVGARLHFGDNTIQHNGVFIYKNTKKDNSIGVSHLNIKNYYNYQINTSQIFGNTGGLLMIRKNLFNSIGGFNENYISCFEDVELNISCLAKGFKNYNSGECVAYHYESQTRNEDPENIKKLIFDYNNNLAKTINNNIRVINNYLINV